mgnify:CR=1 FL=1
MVDRVEYEFVFLGKALEDIYMTEDAAKATVWLINDLPVDCVAGLDLVQLRCLCVRA